MFLGLVFQVIRNGSKERTGALQTAFDVTLHQILDERHEIERVLARKAVDVTVLLQNFIHIKSHKPYPAKHVRGEDSSHSD